MKTSAILGIILVVIGVLSLGYQGFTYSTRKKEVDVGSIEITKKENHTVPLPPIIGVVALVGGVVLIVGANKSSS